MKRLFVGVASAVGIAIGLIGLVWISALAGLVGFTFYLAGGILGWWQILGWGELLVIWVVLAGAVYLLSHFATGIFGRR